jgi:proline dehydrogenase
VKALTFLARRFVAGETAEEAVAAGRRLAARGIRATFDLLGEDVRDEGSARRSADACVDLVRRIPPEVDRNVSIKLSMMGLSVSPALATELAGKVVAAAREAGGFVRIDMEGSRHTQATLDVFRELRREHADVGVVLQAYLHRTETDVRTAIGRGDRIRLCKGAYKEPPEVAWSDMEQIRESFKRYARGLLEHGHYPAIATHDEALIQDTLTFTREKGIDADRFEFQMLYGLRRRRWDELVRAGYNMRVYVPYGTHWMPYFYRRLRERRENVLFVLKGLFGG